MLKALKSLRARPAPSDPDDLPSQTRRLQVAALSLLLELAYADGEFTADERQHVEEAAVRHFDLDPAGARRLMAVADEARRQSVDLHQFTSIVAQHYDEGQRMVLAELRWRVIHADGRLSERESSRASSPSLLDLRPRYLAEARRRAQGTKRGAD